MSAPTTPNAELAWQAYAVATKFERLDMDTWCYARQDVVALADLVSPEPSCGTTACLAGWGAALAGYRVTWRGHILRQSGAVVSTNIETFMARLWGITDSAAAILFHVDNEDVEEEMVRVFGPRPGSFGSGCRCDYLGTGTPEHTPSALCRSLRPDADRDPEPSQRTWTPDEKLPEGGTRFTVKRACNGCGELLGDVTDAEMDRAIAGLPAEDVRGECPRCRPHAEAES